MPITPLHPVRRFSQEDFTEFEPCYYEEHARRLLVHTDLQAILWINIGLHEVKFVTIR